MKQYYWIDGALKVLAPAKINLSLLIGDKRSDGFHELETIMAKVAWYDQLFFEKTPYEGIELVCEGKYWAPDGEKNLVWRAIELLIDSLNADDRAKITGGVSVTLTKNIPAGSGLGSASSDAAAALLGIKKLYGLSIPMMELDGLCAKLGSDVAFFLYGPMAFCWGRGEKIREIKEKFPFKALLVLPGVNVSTKRVYDNFTVNQALFDEQSGKINALIGKKSIDLIADLCANMLEESCFDLYQQVARIKDYIGSLGIGPTCLSGSGSTVYCLIDGVSDEDVKRYQLKLKDGFNCESLVVYNNRW